MNQPDVPEVVWHFVDETWLLPAVSACLRHIPFAEPAKLFRRKIGQHTGISILVRSLHTRIAVSRLLPPHFNHDPLDFCEFLCALDMRVRGEDLLDQRRPGAWQTDNENRIGVQDTDTGANGEEPCGTHPNLLPCIRLGNVWMIAAFSPLQCVALLVKLP